MPFLTQLNKFLFPFLIVCFFCKVTLSQSNFTTAFSGKFTLGTYFLSMENFGLQRWNSTFNTVFRLDPSLKFFYKNSMSLSLGGGATLYNYDFYHENTNFYIAHFTFHAESNLQKYFYIKDSKLDAFYLGCGVGVIDYDYDSKRTVKSNFEALTTTIKSTPIYFTPQIGTYRKTDRMGMSLAVQYCFYVPNSSVISFEMENGLAQATSNHNGSYIGLNIIVDYDLHMKRKSKSIEKVKRRVEMPPDLLTRTQVETQKLHFKNSEIKVFAWDRGEVDNDTISLVLNGEMVLYKHRLNHFKKKVKLQLNQGENVLMMYAHNEGTVKPNTAAIIIKSKSKKHKLLLNSTMESNAVIHLELLE